MSSWKFSINPLLPIGHLAIVLVAFTYLVGYLILHTFTGTIGLPARGLLDAEYLEAGVFFEMVSLAIVAMPALLWLLLRGLHKPDNLPSANVGAGDIQNSEARSGNLGDVVD